MGPGGSESDVSDPRKPSSVRDHQLRLEILARFGEAVEYRKPTVLKRPQRSIDQRPVVKLFPREFDGARPLVSQGADVMKVTWQVLPRIIEGARLLADLSECRKRIVRNCVRLQTPFAAVSIDNSRDRIRKSVPNQITHSVSGAAKPGIAKPPRSERGRYSRLAVESQRITDGYEWQPQTIRDGSAGGFHLVHQQHRDARRLDCLTALLKHHCGRFLDRANRELRCGCAL